MILILSDYLDFHLGPVVEHLRDAKAPFRFVPVAEISKKYQVAFSFGHENHGQRLIGRDGDSLDLNSIRSVWYRKPGPPEQPQDLAEEEREFVHNEWEVTLQGLYALLADRYWLNPLPHMRRAGNKLLQLQVAEALSFSIPKTLVTTSPEEARRFFEKAGGAIVYKPMKNGILGTRPGPWAPESIDHVIYTTPLANVSAEDLDRVRVCPCFLQEYVEKEVELRITVVGDQLFAAEIHSQTSEATRHDWRHDGLENVVHRPHTLPEKERVKIFALLRRLGLRFGAIDMILTPRGEYVFLEINPNGNYGWIERLTGLPISRAIAQCLVDGAQS